MRTLCWWLLSFAVVVGTSGLSFAQNLITSTNIDVDNRIVLSNKKVMQDYLERFIGQVASKEQEQSAEKFFSELLFVRDAHCSINKNKNGYELSCSIKPKYLLKKITINNLRASLLESELIRKLPVQAGQLIDFSEKNAENMKSVVKTRIETFLRKNGFYGGVVSVSFVEHQESLSVELIATIENGEFARVNEVRIEGNSPLRPKTIQLIYERMCLSFNRIFSALSMGSLRCYSAELEREATERLQERLANLGYITASIRVKRTWIDPHDDNSPKNCQKKDLSDLHPRCIDLRIDISKGPHVTWAVKMMKGRMVSRNAFLRLMSSLFAVDQFSRLTAGKDLDAEAADRMIIEQELLQQVNFIEAKNMDEQEIKTSVENMREYLRGKGYINAEIVPLVTKENINNIHIDFQIYPGQPYSLRTINVAPGQFSHLISEKEFEPWLKPRSFGSSGSISYEQVSLALDEVIRRAQEQGYNDASGRAELTALDTNVSADFFINSSGREMIKKIIINNGVEALNQQVIASLKNCDNFTKSRHCAGSSLVRRSVASDEARISNFYQNHDYLYAKVRSELQKFEDGYELVFYIFDERYGENSDATLRRQNINNIIISGNRTTNESVIKRLFPKNDGELNSLSLKKGIANLRESGRFSRIDQTLVAAEPKSDDIYFALQLVERPSLTLDTGFTLSTDHLLSLEAELEEINLFSSMLQLKTKLALGFFWGRQSSITNRFTWPFIWGKPFSFSLHAPMIVYDDKTHLPKPFRRFQSRIGAGLDWRASAHLTPYIRYFLVYNKEQSFTPANVPHPSFAERIRTLDGLIPTLRDAPSKIAGVLKPGISYINIDNPLDPRSGFDSNNWVELSGKMLQGSIPFVNVGTQNRYFIPLGAFTLALQATFMRAFITPSVKNFEHLRDFSSSMDKLGGDRSVRGYDGSIGIEELKAEPGYWSGYFSNIANIELRFPLTEGATIGQLNGAIFVDQGTLMPCSNFGKCMEHTTFKQLIKERGFGLSVGGGLRYILPVGPLSLDWGFSPIHREHRLHFQFGYAF